MGYKQFTGQDIDTKSKYVDDIDLFQELEVFSFDTVLYYLENK